MFVSLVCWSIMMNCIIMGVIGERQPKVVLLNLNVLVQEPRGRVQGSIQWIWLDILTCFFVFCFLLSEFAYRTNFTVFIVMQYVAANNWRRSGFTDFRFLIILYTDIHIIYESCRRYHSSLCYGRWKMKICLGTPCSYN